MISPSISLLIVNYNRERYLSAAIESVLAQTRSDFELLIRDDGSTDSSLNIAYGYARKDKRLRILEGKHQGVAAARKAAISHATGKYLGWVDSDDYLAPSALAETAAILDANPGIGMVYTDHLYVDEEDNIKGLGQSCLIPYSKERLMLDFMTFHFRLIRRSVFEEVGGINTSCPYAYDYDLCLRISEVTTIEHLQKPLYYYRDHEAAISHQKRDAQVRDSYQAMTDALKRRGLANYFEIRMNWENQKVAFLRKPEFKTLLADMEKSDKRSPAIKGAR